MPGHYRYSRWDGTQVGFELDAEDVLSDLTDDVLYHGDLDAALRRLLQSGFSDENGERVAGLRELLERLRRRRQEELEAHDLGGVYREIADRLDRVVETERAGIDDLVARAEASGDHRRAEVAAGTAADRRMQLDLTPPDLAEKVRALQGYEFISPQAKADFDALVEDLRSQLTKSWFDRMAGALSDTSPAQMQRTREMFDALSRMLEQRQAGRPVDPSFESFMERFGDYFPGAPADLDALLEQMAAQMAAMQSMLSSMSPEQRAELQGLAQALMEDLDLAWQVDRLSANLRAAFPGAGWDRRFSFSGNDPLGLAEAAGVFQTLGDIDRLENLLRTAHSPGALADVDLEKAAELVGPEGSREFYIISKLTS
ncbi:MAG: hypothetical protein ACRDZY_00910, partial [Acidimicrobiales bacterium]